MCQINLNSFSKTSDWFICVNLPCIEFISLCKYKMSDMVQGGPWPYWQLNFGSLLASNAIQHNDMVAKSNLSTLTILKCRTWYKEYHGHWPYWHLNLSSAGFEWHPAYLWQFLPDCTMSLFSHVQSSKCHIGCKALLCPHWHYMSFCSAAGSDAVQHICGSSC